MSAVDLEAVLDFRERGLLPEKPRVVELGAQQISADIVKNGPLLEKTRDAFGLVPKMPPGDRPHAIEFWKSLGGEYLAVDVEGQTILPLDLNFDSVPWHLRGRFHLATNFGTTEHVINQLNAFKIMHDLVGPGCMMLHNLPSSGFIDHGLVNYTPKFFWRLARANGYEVALFRYIGNPSDKQRISQELREWFGARDSEFEAKEQELAFANISLLVGLRKQFDIGFVPPIDLADDAEPPNPRTKDRYWTQFAEDPWEQAKNGSRRDKPNMVVAGNLFFRRVARGISRRFSEIYRPHS